MLKSYAPDLHYSQRFLDSFRKYANESIPLFVVVPEQDVVAFEEVFRSDATVLSESLWSNQLVDYPIHGNHPGYINQEIIKLAFAEKGLLRNYLCADSEAVFLRPFSSSDFMDPGGIPYSFITEDHDLHVDPMYFERYWHARDRWLKNLRSFLELPLSPYRTCHGFGVFSSDKTMELLDFLRSRDMSIADALELSPYEFSWYNFWVEKTDPNFQILREPIFKTVHIESQYRQLAIQHVTLEDLSRGFVGVVINSGFSRSFEIDGIIPSVSSVLADHSPYSALIQAAFERTFIKIPRVRRMLKVGKRAN